MYSLQVQRHGMEIDTGYHTFQHEHDSEKRPRDYKRLPGQKKVNFTHYRKFHFVQFIMGYAPSNSNIYWLQELKIAAYNFDDIAQEYFANYATRWSYGEL